MKSQITDDFLDCLAALPVEVRTKARRAYELWRNNHSHPSLHFKPIRGHAGVYSVRIGIGWRAVGQVAGDTITWYWIGSHADYDTLIA